MMKSWMSTLRVRLTMAFIAVIVVVNASVSLFTVLHVSRVFLDEVQGQVRTSVNAGQGIYDTYVSGVTRVLRAVSVDAELAASLRKGSGEELGPQLEAIRGQADLDILSLIAPDGHVLYRVRNPGARGDDLSGLPVVSKARHTGEPASGTVILGPELLRREGGAGWPSGMAIAAAVPVRAGRQLLGFLLGARVLGRRHEIVDRIRQEALRGSRSTDTGTQATIFEGDARISTSVESDHSYRAIGTRMSPEVRERVLNRGQTWSDRAVVVDRWCLTAYRPLRDPDGRIIGALGLGLPEAPLVAPQNAIVTMFLSAMGLTTLGSLLLLFFVTTSVLRPIGRVIEMCRRVIGGDLSARVETRPPGEMGLLSQAVNQMADAVQQREQKLQVATQRQIGQSEKLASIGRLAAGIAHEVNNPLTGVLTFAHLLRKRPNLEDQDREDLDLILRETTRVREIVKGLLDFARESPSAKQPLDLNDAIRQTLALVRSQKEFRKVTIEERLDEKLPTISGDRNQLQQVLLNLSLNACEAMAEGGKLLITTSTEPGRVVIRISDTGCGIAREHLERIFDPFFTTKPVGKGTGLGLSVSYGIVQQHEGTIEVESVEGEGATFIVKLPALPGPAA